MSATQKQVNQNLLECIKSQPCTILVNSHFYSQAVLIGERESAERLCKESVAKSLGCAISDILIL